MSKIRFVGLDVHADTIAVAVAEAGGEVRSLGVIPNREESVRRLVWKLGEIKQLRACYEAGPTGYVLYWQLTALGVQCDVIAPTLAFGTAFKIDARGPQYAVVNGNVLRRPVFPKGSAGFQHNRIAIGFDKTIGDPYMTAAVWIDSI